MALLTLQYYLLGMVFMSGVMYAEKLEDIASTERRNTSLDKLEAEGYEDAFLDRLLQKYGTDGVVTVTQVRELVKNIKDNIIRSASTPKDESKEEAGKTSAISKPSGDDDVEEQDVIRKDVSTKAENPKQKVSCSNDSKEDCQDSKPRCLSMIEIFAHHSLTPQESANSSKLRRMSPTILYQLQNPQCHPEEEHSKHVSRRPSSLEVWLYGLLCVTLINLCALMGMAFLPLMRRSFYQRMLMFMVALAVGTLTGSGLLFLIPESFEMTAPDSPYADLYVWRSLTIIGGIYLFFLVERVLQMIMKAKQNLKERKKMQEMPIASVPTHSVHLEDSINMSFKPVPVNITAGTAKHDDNQLGDHLLPPDSSAAKLCHNNSSSAASFALEQIGQTESAAGSPAHGHSHGPEIRSVAWMVIFGDGLHNFIDGLSIGAAFSGSIMTGISVSLAVICEELPHELGDFAILLNSGMSMRQALGYNFLSACMCYLGLIVGVLVGEATHGAVWIFAVAGGMFLYIALVDMLPEVNHAAGLEEQAGHSSLSVFLLQNAGILTGLGIMLLLAVFSGRIDLTSLEN